MRDSNYNDNVNHPKHYTTHPSGVECIDVTEHFNFNIGNAIKYLWRTDLKNTPIDKLKDNAGVVVGVATFVVNKGDKLPAE